MNTERGLRTAQARSLLVGLLLLTMAGFVGSSHASVTATVARSDADGRSYYVSSSGDDSLDGTAPERAWRSIERANQASFSPGDELMFEAGQVFVGSLQLGLDDHGTPDRPIVIGSHGPGRAQIDAGDRDGVIVHNVGGVRLRNLHVIGSGTERNSGSGVLFRNDLPDDTKLDFIRVEQVEVQDFGKYGIAIGGETGKSGYRDVRIIGASAHGNGVAGINLYGKYDQDSSSYAHQDVYVGWSEAYNNLGITGPDRPHTGSGIIMSDVDGGMIERSVAYGNGWNSNSDRAGPVGIWAWDANRVVIQHNESFANGTAGRFDGGGFDLDGGTTQSILQYNYSHDNTGAGLAIITFAYSRPTSDNTIRYNISHDDGQLNTYGSLTLAAGYDADRVLRTSIYNNTIYQSPKSDKERVAIDIPQESVDGANFWNNVLVAGGRDPIVRVAPGQSNLTFLANSYFAGGQPPLISWAGELYAGLPAWRASTNQERLDGADLGLGLDPLLVIPGKEKKVADAARLEDLQEYRLTPASPLRTAGLNLRRRFGLDPGERDFFGNSLRDADSVSIGAYQAPGD